MATKVQILAGRKAVDTYREAHAQLYVDFAGETNKIQDGHVSLLDTLKSSLKAQGFNSLDEFWVASDDYNAKQLGFKSLDDSQAKATEAQRQQFNMMWS